MKRTSAIIVALVLAGSAQAPARGGGAAAGTSILDQWVPLGDYTVTLDVGGRTLTGKATVAKTIVQPIRTVPRTIR